MIRDKVSLLHSALVVLGVSTSGLVWAQEARPAIKQIEIKSEWGGPGGPRETDVVIRHKNGKYEMGRNPVDTTLVDALIAALREAPIAAPDPQNLGMTKAWLEKNAESSGINYTGNFAEGAPNQKALYVKTFTDVASIQSAVTSLFNFARTSDNSSVEITVNFDNGKTVSATTYSYYLMMLPWDITSGDQSNTTFNANVSRAVAALLPEKATNRSRLAGDDIVAQLADAVMRSIKTEWNLLDAENKAQDSLAVLRTRYSIEDAKISSVQRPEYGRHEGTDSRETSHPTANFFLKTSTHTETNVHAEANLHATLHRADFPPNVSDALTLLYHDGKVEGADEFLHLVDYYEALALSIPWLNNYIRDHPDVPVRISYTHDASFSGKATPLFGADMHAVGKDDLAAAVRGMQPQIALLMIGVPSAESYWLVLPDKHMVLWRWGGPTGLLKWRSTDFSTRECSEYKSVIGGCVGALVSPDGSLGK